MLHVTNGDSAGGTLRRAGLEGEVLAWQDILHEGPVPADADEAELRLVRARFLADGGAAPLERVVDGLERRDARLREALEGGEEIVLWFEHDLYDQLQLVQILDRIGGVTRGADRASMVCIGEHPAVERFLGLGQLGPEHFVELYPTRAPVTAEQVERARAAWAAFRAPDPTELEALAAEDTAALPFLGAALRRHLEQFPSTRDGLCRTEHQIVEAVVAGVRRFDRLFQAMTDMEPAPYMGDSTFFGYVEGLCAGPRPLLRATDGPVAGEPGWLRREVEPTAETDAVRRGEADWVALRGGIDRWLGGVHLAGERPRWRWSREAGHLTRA